MDIINRQFLKYFGCSLGKHQSTRHPDHVTVSVLAQEYGNAKEVVYRCWGVISKSLEHIPCLNHNNHDVRF